MTYEWPFDDEHASNDCLESSAPAKARLTTAFVKNSVITQSMQTRHAFVSDEVEALIGARAPFVDAS